MLSILLVILHYVYTRLCIEKVPWFDMPVSVLCTQDSISSMSQSLASPAQGATDTDVPAQVGPSFTNTKNMK